MFIDVANAELRSKHSGSNFRAMFYKLFMHKRARTVVTITCITFLFPLFVHVVKDVFDSSKVILLYSSYRGQKWSVPDGSSIFRNLQCPVSSCKISHDPALLGAAEGVVFHIPSLSPTTPLPSSKPDYQKWIFLALVPVEQYSYEHRSLLEKTDWTSTYSTESDIRIPYGKFVSGSPVGQPVPDFTRKTKLVAQLTDQCNTPNQRRLYVDALSAHLGSSKLKSHGSCGGTPCSSSDQCLKDMRNQYKFYLSFETMNCKEFISTEFWENALQYNMVPVAMGGRKKDYERYAPPESFIHAGDFNTSKELAEFLLRLDNNNQKYQQYFDWQALGRADFLLTNGDFSKSTYWCDLCEALHEPDKVRSPRKGTRPIWEWWTIRNQCDNKILWKDLETQIKDMDV